MKCLILIILALGLDSAKSDLFEIKADNSKVVLSVDTSNNLITVKNDAKVVQNLRVLTKFSGQINQVETAKGFILKDGNGKEIEFSGDIDETGFALFTVSRRNLAKSNVESDCVELNPHNWYGGPQQKYQYWPIQKLQLVNYSYVSKEADNCAVAERYWLNSAGSFIYVEDDAPLFIDQNFGVRGYMCLVTRKALPYDTYTEKYNFVYKIGVAGDSRLAHMQAINKILGKPSGYPDERMVQYPIWSTWARYKAPIDDSVVREFAKEINFHSFPNSQYEIDDDWEICYGALTFRTSKFPNIKGLVSDLKAQGYRVTLWIHPFININCEPYFSEAKAKGYFVSDHNGNVLTQWWNSKVKEAAYLDFTKKDVADWFVAHLRQLQQTSGIDSYKFDAGELSWSPPDPVFQSYELKPHSIVTDYVKAVAQFGDLVEVRSAYRTQNLPIFLRIVDKDSEWNWNNGLPTLVTTLLQLNMVGYPLVLPDMIGGNGYNDHPPNKEMFIRWLQANVFMPSLQFSFVPWDYDNETIALSHKFVNLHAQYTTEIMKRFKLAVEKGEPVNPPLWWISPDDSIAQRIYDRKEIKLIKILNN